MPGTKTITAKTLLIGTILSCGILPAEENWFPLMTGSQWTYRASWPAGDTFSVLVTGTRVVGDLEYYVVTGWPGRGAETLLRKDNDGKIWELRSGAEKPSLFLNGHAAKDEDAGNAGDDCNGAGRVDGRSNRVSTAFGDYSNALRIQFNVGPCADAGVEADYWLPWVGLVKRTFQTIAGPRNYDLIYARLGDVTVLTPPEFSFSLASARAVYVPPDVLPAVVGMEPTLEVRITLRNSTSDGVTLDFPSSQDYDLSLKSSDGTVLWRWSATRSFAAIARKEKISGERVWVEKVPLTGNDGRMLPPGTYTVEAELATKPAAFKASVSLEIRKAL